MSDQLFHNIAMYNNVQENILEWKNACVTWDKHTVFRDFIEHVRDTQAPKHVETIFGPTEFLEFAQVTDYPTEVTRAFYPRFDHTEWSEIKLSTRQFFYAVAHVSEEEWLELDDTQRTFWLVNALYHVNFVIEVNQGQSSPKNLPWLFKMADPVISTLLSITTLTEEAKNSVAPYLIGFPHWLVMANPRIAWPLSRAALSENTTCTSPERMMMNFNRLNHSLEALPFTHQNCAWGYADFSLAQAILERRGMPWKSRVQHRIDLSPEILVLLENASFTSLKHMIAHMQPGSFALPLIPELDFNV